MWVCVGVGVGVCEIPTAALLSVCSYISALLQWQISTRLFSKEQVDVITDCLMKCFCYKDMDVRKYHVDIWVQSEPSLLSGFVLISLQYFSYVMSVLYPECLVRIIMDFYSLPFDEVSLKVYYLKYTHIVPFVLRQRRR